MKAGDEKNAEMLEDHGLEANALTQARTLEPDLELRSLLEPVEGAEADASWGLT